MLSTDSGTVASENRSSALQATAMVSGSIRIAGKDFRCSPVCTLFGHTTRLVSMSSLGESLAGGRGPRTALGSLLEALPHSP